MILVDTGPLVAAANRNDTHHRADDLFRAAELVEQYADLPLGTTDACIVALAEQLNITELVTLDRRHFNVVRPRHVRALTLVP